MQLQILMLMLIIFIQVTAAHETFTRSQLRSLYQKQMDKKLDEEIQQIVEQVVATAQKNETNYSFTYSYLWQTENTYLLGTKVMHKFEDKTIIDRLQNILIDSNITITEPRCCKYPDIKANENASNCIKYPDRMKTVCKFIHILWI